MKRFFLISIIMMLFVSIGCKKGDDGVLATYNDGQITRGDFEAWYTAGGLRAESVNSSIKSQKHRLKELFLERTAVKEAANHPFFVDEDFKAFVAFAENQQLAAYTDFKIKSDLKINTEIFDISVIKLNLDEYEVKDNKTIEFGGDKEKALEAKMPRINEIYEKLKKGENFDTVAKDYTQDKIVSLSGGNRVGWVIKSMLAEQVYEAILKLGKGKYTAKPIVTDNAVYIVKLYDRKKITNKNLINRTIVKDSRTNQRLLGIITTDANNEVLTEIKAGTGFNYSGKDSTFKDPKEVLFEVGENKYLVSDLNRLVVFLVEKTWVPASYEEAEKNERPKASQISADDKRRFVDQWALDTMMAYEGRKRGFDKDEEFQKGFKLSLDSSIYSMYKFKFVMGDKIPSNAELLEYYNNEYAKKINEGSGANPQAKRNLPPFATVRDQLRQEWYNSTNLNNRLTWEENSVKNANFQIDEKKLVPERKLKPGEIPPAPTY